MIRKNLPFISRLIKNEISTWINLFRIPQRDHHERKRISPIKKILVFSHMFPHQHRIILGSFIAEQIKALRDYEDLDIRVVSCRPFYYSRNPIKLFYILRTYDMDIQSSQWFLQEGIPTLYIPYIVTRSFDFHAYFYMSAISSVLARIKCEFDFELVHAHTAYLDGYAGLYASKLYDTPLIITEHTGPFTRLTDRLIVRRITTRSLAHADRVICVSNALEKEVKRWVPPDHHPRFTVIPNGIDTDLFYPSKDIAVSFPKRILSVMSLDDNKNPFLLLESFKLLITRGMDIILTIAGDGELQERISQWISSNDLASRVRLAGLISREEVARLLRDECDVLVLSSKAETFGVIVIEALASGKPVVSTRCGGPEDILVEPYLGELCENNNPGKMAESIAKVLSNKNHYDADKIRSFAIEHYDYKKIARRINIIYQGTG